MRSSSTPKVLPLVRINFPGKGRDAVDVVTPGRDPAGGSEAVRSSPSGGGVPFPHLVTLTKERFYYDRKVRRQKARDMLGSSGRSFTAVVFDRAACRGRGTDIPEETARLPSASWGFGNMAFDVCKPPSRSSNELDPVRPRPKQIQKSAEWRFEACGDVLAGCLGDIRVRHPASIDENCPKEEANPTNVWVKEQLRNSAYKVDTMFANEFIVIDKSPSSLMPLGGLSPRVVPAVFVRWTPSSVSPRNQTPKPESRASTSSLWSSTA
ncbi:hypothetical protein LZ30DRAFT_109449 [Colletotrichum cereale]|nr:hypothetical protein LZ30DRAFT_109449 [Colletotrichum cereale]